MPVHKQNIRYLGNQLLASSWCQTSTVAEVCRRGKSEKMKTKDKMCGERKSLKRTQHGEMGPGRARDLWLCWQRMAQPATVKAMWSTGFTGVVSIPRTGGIDTTPWMNALSGLLTSLARLWLFSVVLAHFTRRDQIFFLFSFLLCHPCCAQPWPDNPLEEITWDIPVAVAC